MTIKPFAIQGADLTLGGVSLQAGTTGVVIPGVTRATSYVPEEVNDTGDQTYSFNSAPVVIDHTYYSILNGDYSPSGYTEAEYVVTELDDDDFIDGIEIVSQGSGWNLSSANGAKNNDMWAYTGSEQNPFASFVNTDWIQIPFRVKIRAGEIETIGGGGTSVTYREVNYPNGEEGDTKGTIAVSAAGDAYICIADFNEDDPQSYTVQQSGSFNITQTGNRMILTITDSTSDEEDVIALWANRETAISSGWTVSGESLSGTYEALEINIWTLGSQDGLRYITWLHRTNDPTTISDGEEFTVTYSPGQRHIWVPISTGNIVINGNSMEVGGVGYLNLKTNADEVVIGSNGNYPVKVSVNEEDKEWTFGTDGSITFPDGTKQTTAASGGGITVTTDLWIAAGYSPGGAAVVSSTNGVDWTTSDYMMDGLSIEKVAISPDRIVYIISGLPNGAASGLYHTDAPENVPVLATGTDGYGMGFPLDWREVNYLGGKFVAVGSYTVPQTISTDITSLTLAAGGRTASQLTITNTAWDYSGQQITISGATNTELNGTWRLSYNNLDTLGSGVYDILTLDYQIPTFTSTDVSGAVIADFTGDCTFPIYSYSTDGVAWTYGTVDGMYIDLVVGPTPQARMADVAYNGTGYLIPVVKNTFNTDNPYVEGYGAFYITDLAGGANGPQFIPGSGPNSLPGTFNNIAAYADGTFFVSDDQYTVWTNADPLNDPWVDHNIQSALTAQFGYSVGNNPGEQNAEILDSVAGTVGGQEMFVTTVGDGAVVWTTDNGTTWNVVIVEPYVLTMTLDTQGANTLLDFDGIETPRNWGKITIQVTGDDDVRWNGTYYAYNNTPDNIYKLYDGVEGNAIDSSAWTAPANPFTVTLSHGIDVDKIHVADDACIVSSSDNPDRLYRSTDMITWTEVFTNDAYYVNDIYYGTRTATSTNRLDYTDEATGYNSTAVLTYDFDVDVDNAHLNIRGDGSWDIGSNNFDTKIYAAGPEEPTNIIVQANNRYWTFDDAGGLRFPDNTVQTTAFVNRNINLDGGGAAVQFEQEVGFVDGGFSATRHGVADPVFDGGNRLTSNNQFNVNGGGA